MDTALRVTAFQPSQPVTIRNVVRAGSLKVSYSFDGSPLPDSASIKLLGQIAGAPDTLLDSYSGVADATRTVTLGATVFDNFELTASWSGGYNVRLTATFDLSGSGPVYVPSGSSGGGSGTRGSLWYESFGAPTVFAGQLDNDMCLDVSGTGNVYQLTAGVWTLSGSIVGPAGSPGADGSPGAPGNAGARGSLWYSVVGVPGVIVGQANNDLALDSSGTGNVYQLVAGVWTLRGSILGPSGAAGTPGTPGAAGTRGSLWYSGSGAPSAIGGQLNDDLYLDTSGTGNVYQLVGGSWTLLGSIVGPAGTPGAAGATGMRGSLWYSGSGAPGVIAGQLADDLYLDISGTGNIYSYNGSSWTLSGTIIGPAGTPGTPGTPGAAGSPGSAGARGSLWYSGSGAPTSIGGQANNDLYLDTSGTANVYQLVTGSWTLLGSIKGDKGDKGDAGTPGSAGATGTRGSLWNEAAGAPTTIAGQLNGDMYLNTTTSDVYQLQTGTWTLVGNIKGSKGDKGDAGATGATGAAGNSNTVSGSKFAQSIFNATQRAFGTQYQNTTGQPIIVLCNSHTNTGTQQALVGNVSASVSVNQTTFDTAGAGDQAFSFFAVPNNYYYKVNGGTWSTWTEYTLSSGSIAFSGELSGSRSLSSGSSNSVYQNTSGNAMIVCVVVASITSAGTNLFGYSDATTTPTTVVAENSNIMAGGTQTAWLLVPNNHYYRVACAQGSIQNWNEWTLPFNAAKSADLAVNQATRGLANGAAVDSGTVGPWWINNQGKDLLIAANTTLVTGDTSLLGYAQPGCMGTATGFKTALTSKATYHVTLPLLVMPGEFYMIGEDSASAPTLSNWWEYQLG